MTRQEFYSILDQVIQDAKSMLRNNTPTDSGNMRDSWRIEKTGDKYNIYLDTNQAPYAVYTNEPWKDDVNPNESWIPDGFDLVMKLLQQRLGGVATKTYKKDGDE